MKEVLALRWTLTRGGRIPVVLPHYPTKLGDDDMSDPSFPHQEELIVMSKRVVGAHYGFWELSSDTLLYVTPLCLSDVRPAGIGAKDRSSSVEDAAELAGRTSDE